MFETKCISKAIPNSSLQYDTSLCVFYAIIFHTSIYNRLVYCALYSSQITQEHTHGRVGEHNWIDLRLEGNFTYKPQLNTSGLSVPRYFTSHFRILGDLN